MNIWLIEIITEYQYLDAIIAIFEDDASAISSFEYEADANYLSAPNDKWCIEVFYNEMPNEQSIHARLAALEMSAPSFIIKEVENKDWVSLVQNNYPPVVAGEFFICNTNYTGEILASIQIIIDPERAFGTGEHETTKMCLQAITYLKDANPINILDLGTGSAILAIASAKLWQNQVMATDIDPDAVLIAESNVIKNNVQHLVTTMHSDGFNDTALTSKAPFDLIIANILASPLIALAHQIKQNTKPYGKIILSGFLDYQMPELIEKYQEEGFKLEKIFNENHWVSMIMIRTDAILN